MVSAINPSVPRDGVPARKADLRANLMAAKVEIEELQFRKIENGMPFDMNGSVLRGPVLRTYTETTVRPNIENGSLVLDLSKGNVFVVNLIEHVESVIFHNPPPEGQTASIVLILGQDRNGGWRLAWPGSVIWPGAHSPVVSTNPDARDMYALVTNDGGTSWFGLIAGQAFR